MPQNRPKQTDPGAERRRASERRKLRADSGGRDKLLELLAKLLAFLTGVFAGLFIAYFISFLFIKPFEQLIVTKLAEIREKQGEISEYEPEFSQAESQYRKLKSQEETAIRQREGLPDGPANSGLAPPAAAAPTPPAAVPPVAKTELAEAEERFRKADNHMKGLTSRLDSLQGELADYQNTILVLNLLSFAVVLIMGLLGYLLYDLYYARLRISSAQWGALFAARAIRTGPLLIGFFAGMILAVLLLLALFTTIRTEYGFLSLPIFRLVFGAFTTIVLGIVGALIGASYFSPPPPERDPYEEFRRPAAPNLLDSSVLIDGRVYEVAINGFIQGTLVVPDSVLKELQTLADSGDERKRLKGRRGLDMVNRLKGDSRLDCMVIDDSGFDWQARGADDHLIALAKAMGANVVTNDSNLNRVASARDVKVININALANAVKTNHLPGDYIELDITDRGKQRGQGVGYLPDGTMVVVEDGEPYIGMVKTIKLTSISQTQAGRLLFGRVDLAESRGGAAGSGGHGGGGR